MASNPIVFAMANSLPEVMPEDIQGLVRVTATGRSDYPNQINNSLAFPGVFVQPWTCAHPKSTKR